MNSDCVETFVDDFGVTKDYDFRTPPWVDSRYVHASRGLPCTVLFRPDFRLRPRYVPFQTFHWVLKYVLYLHIVSHFLLVHGVYFLHRVPGRSYRAHGSRASRLRAGHRIWIPKYDVFTKYDVFGSLNHICIYVYFDIMMCVGDRSKSSEVWCVWRPDS